MYDKRYVERIDRGWPRWLAFILGPPASKDYEAALVYLATYSQAKKERRIGVGILGSVIADDQETAERISKTFGLRF